MKNIYRNIIGMFLLENNQVKEEYLFKKEEILSEEKREKAWKEFLEKHKGTEEADAETKAEPKILEIFTQPKYLKRLREANILITKRKISESTKPDHLVSQAINGIDEIDKAANILVKRLREWYELYNPEFSHSIENHEKFVELILKNDKKTLLKQVGLEEDESMGSKLNIEDINAIRELARQIENLYELRKKQSKYIETLMKKHFSNINAVCGSLIGAKLLASAGSLEKMAMFPASTVQLLGAEKALFRHMKTGAKPPKFGILINHPLVTKTKKADKGKVARALADKISLAAKIDFFKGEFRGDSLRKELEERFL